MTPVERVLELLHAVVPAERVHAPTEEAARPIVTPESEEEAVEVVRMARSEELVVLPAGLGTKLGWCAPGNEADLVLSSRGLAGVTAFEPEDGTVTARSGTLWSDLAAAVRGRYHLSPDLPGAGRCTLGGALGAGLSGFDRLRFGPLRHQVLGIRALHADATRVKSGGRVVKNVTGYDLHRLWCGSEGTLCFLLEASLRLHPAPAEVAVLRLELPALHEAVTAAQALWRARIQPLALTCRADGLAGACELGLVLAGRAEAVDGAVALARSVLAGATETRGDEARAEAAALRDAELDDGAPPALQVSCRPSLLGTALERLARVEHELGAPVRCHPLLATVSLSLGRTPSPEAVAALTEVLESEELTLRWHAGPRVGEPGPTPPAAAALMRRLKRSLDPDGVFVQPRLEEDA